MILLIVLAYTYPALAAQISTYSQCDCGYSDPRTLATWSEMWHMNFEKNDGSTATMQQQLYSDKELFFSSYIIDAKFNDSYPRVFKKENVRIHDESLEVRVTVDPTKSTPAERIQCGGVGTDRQDFMYGSFRSYMRATKVNGTVAGMFAYNAQGEIDIELLSSLQPSEVYFAMHPGLIENGKASPLTHGNVQLGFDPTDDFHEYRFDWFPNLTVFYVDGVESYRMTTNVLNLPSRVMFNHWTDGNANFSQGPATENASINIKNMTFFFNSTDIKSAPICLTSRAACDIQQIISALQNDSQQAPTTSSGNNSNGTGDTMLDPFEKTKDTSTSGIAMIGKQDLLSCYWIYTLLLTSIWLVFTPYIL
ncbi:uncharacterized protein ATC70_003819 [Mucor velutinosus]|uniref:GH16 domain-containing protein n=1 Tax=Mucor velutinosus TaxID=708070 RepID=A0AAN7HRF6_9FUNG|nr:hypothetical protein ATC70_003819 [Mucor velutinosus]